MMILRSLALLSLLCSLACTQAEPSVDAGSVDAGVADAGPEDAGRQTIGPNPCDCTGLQRCDPEFLDCVEPEVCEEDEDCRGARICVRGGCYDCWGEELAACVGGQLCSNDGTCQSAAQCEDAYDCIDGLSCGEDLRCGPPEPCDADELEPNNRPLEARRIGSVHKGLWTCGQGDWYKVRLRKRAVMVRLRASNGALDPNNLPMVTIYDGAARRPLAVGAQEGTRVIAALLGEPIGQDVLVHVLSPEAFRYDLSIKHLNDFCPVIDAEPNNTSSMALPVLLGAETLGSLCGATEEEDDVDLYQVSVAEGQRIGFMLEQGGANEVYLSLRDAEGALLGEELTLSERTTRGELGVAAQAGTAFVALRGQGAAYRLRIGLFGAAGDCRDDAQEPDDQPDFAQALGGDPVEGVLCPSSTDHLAFDAQGDDGLHLVVTEEQGTGSSWILRSPSGQAIGLQRRPDGLRLDRQRMGEPGRYLLIGSGGAQRSTYRVELELVAGGACTPDFRDPQDDQRAGATELSMNAGSSIYTACADADWFRVTLPSGSGRVSLRRFSSTSVPLSMELFAAESDNPVASTQVAGSEGDLEFSLEQGGEYYLRVLGDANVSTRYQVMIMGPPPSNDTCASPEAIRLRRGEPQVLMGTTEGAHHNAESACGGSRAGDVQYFVQVPEGGGIVRFELETLANEQGRRYDHLISLNRLCGEASELLCDDDSQSNYNDRIEAQLDAGIYTLTVDTLSSFSGGSPFRLTASIGAVDERLPLIAPGDGCSANIPTLPLPENERGTIRVASTSEGLSDSARGSCGFTIEGRDAFFAFELSAAAAVRAEVPYAGRSTLYLRAAACTLPVDLACNLSWRGNQTLALGNLPAGRYVLIYDRMSNLDGPFTLSLTLSDP